MATSIFTDEKLFENEEINIWCNLFLGSLITGFGQSEVDDHFVLTGTVAKIIQGDPVADIKVVPFITDQAPMFEAVLNKYAPSLGGTAVGFEDVIQIIIHGVYIEVWLGVMGTINDINGLKVQDPADIPANIL